MSNMTDAAGPVQAVLFDVNHTLLGIKNEGNSQAAAVGVLYEEVSRRTQARFDADEFRSAYDRAWKTGKTESYDKYRETLYEDVVARTLAEFGIEFSPEELEDVLQIYMEPLYSAAYLIPGMRQILEDVRSRVPVGAITNYKYAAGMIGLLRRAGIMELLDAVAISSEVGWKKPALPIYETILQRLGVEAKSCVLVGNELEKDLWQASQLGMRTVLFSPQEHEWHDAEFADLLRQRIAAHELKCDFVAESADELGTLLSQLTAQSRR
jgi:FMN phosphatase YigB (HAD superfamily)